MVEKKTDGKRLLAMTDGDVNVSRSVRTVLIKVSKTSRARREHHSYSYPR